MSKADKSEDEAPIWGAPNRVIPDPSCAIFRAKLIEAYNAWACTEFIYSKVSSPIAKEANAKRAAAWFRYCWVRDFKDELH